MRGSTRVTLQPAWALLFQSTRPVRRVAELGSLYGFARMKEQNVILSLLCYALLLVLSLFAAAIAWNSFANGVLYRCTDPLFDLWPPFVHPGSGDTYLVSKPLVLMIWGGFVVAAFVLPAVVLWTVRRFIREDERETRLTV